MKEYDTLREEILARSRVRFELLGFLAVAAGIFADGQRGVWLSTVVAVSTVVVAFATWFGFGREIKRIAHQLQKIEGKVNRLVQGDDGVADDVLMWETIQAARWHRPATGCDLKATSPDMPYWTPEQGGSMSDKFKSVGALIVTLSTFGLTVWWLVLIAQRLGQTPTVDAKGNVTLDTYQRAKDILLVVLPLFSAACAYWVGSAGTAKAKEGEQIARDQLTAVVDVSAADVLATAKSKHPEAFK